MAGHEWEDWFEREEFIGQISDIRVQNLQVEREVVQKRTFTRWMNLHLEKCDPPIEVHDLFQDIQDGHILMALLEELSGSKLLHGFKKSSHRIFRLNNIAKVLSFLEERNVKLVSIDAADVADGNSSIILGLIWNIILFFQIKELTGNIRSQFPSSSSLSSILTSYDSDTSNSSTPSDERQSVSTVTREHNKAIKKLLQWVQKRTRKYGVAVQDFGKSWTSGLAFLAVIKSIDPSLVDMRKALLRSARENLEDAFRIAHYSLGIPRLLEPEDVTINAPDEQCIITYVSQFLEHFPGIEQEEPCHLTERSVSVGRLNFHDSDSAHIRNGAYRSRVKERSYMFQRDSTHPPPKILISSVSEDKSAVSPSFRSAATRLWSSADFLADSPQLDDITSSVAENAKESVSKVLTNSNSNFPQLSYTYSSTGSSVPESVTGDSAINSPDSWVESEFEVMPEKFCQSQSDSSLCDSGTAWDVYHATPVEVTTHDEGFVLSLQDKSPDDQLISQSHINEEIYPLSSLESTQEHNQGYSKKKQAEAVKPIETNLENCNQYVSLEQVPNQSEPGIMEVECNHINRDQKDSKKSKQSQLNSKNELPSSDHFDDLTMQSDVEDRTYKEFLKKSVDSTEDVQGLEGQYNGQIQTLNEQNKEAEVDAECQKTDPFLEDKRDDSGNKLAISKERDEGAPEAQDKPSEGVLIDLQDHQESINTETGDATADVHPTIQEEESNTSLKPTIGMNIPLISISSKPEEHDKTGICEPERHTCAVDKEVHQTEATENCDTNDSDGKSPEIPSYLVSKNVKLTAAEQMMDIDNVHLDETNECDIRNCSNVDTCVPCSTDNMEISEAIEECQFPLGDFQTVNTNQDITAHTSSTDVKSQTVKTEQEKPNDTFSQIDTASIQQSTLDLLSLESNGNIGILCYYPVSVSRNMDLVYTEFDQSSLTEDLVGDLIEPMDLFYPDKEEPMLTEPPDTEMQSWPSVLSVSALQPAPVSDTLPLDDQPLSLLDEDFRNGVDLLQENDKMITNTGLEIGKSSEPQEHCLLPGEKMGDLWGDDVPAYSSDLTEVEQQMPGSARENTEAVRCNTTSSSRQDESQNPPVLRHRKGACFTECMDNQTVMTAETRNTDTNSSDLWWSGSWELHLLLLLWLLLYCFWLLPQMDLKTLPSLLLNLHH